MTRRPILSRRPAAHRLAALGSVPILVNEKFTVYVPRRAPAQSYALLVFVPPWRDSVVPPHWIGALDRHAMIFVSASNSGNDANVLDRREPLALLAAYNVMRRYPVDPARVYAGGFSGGSRVALRLAVAYPDVFRGALLDAGSDSIGDGQLPLPAADLFRQFQESSRLVYLTGQDDSGGLDQDAHRRRSVGRTGTGESLAGSRQSGRRMVIAEKNRHPLRRLGCPRERRTRPANSR